MTELSGLALVVAAAVFQGTFLVPMTRMRKWAWEHAWAVFSLLAMVAFNWILSVALLPNPVAVYRSVAHVEVLVLALFGAGWGCGAVLFGLGMNRLGLALGYPLIMGLNAAVGAAIPLALSRGDLTSSRSLAMTGGIALAIAGIVVSSVAGSKRSAGDGKTGPHCGFRSGLVIAIAAGFLCCLPNIGMSYGARTIAAAKALGASDALAGNAVWAVFFTFGGVVNIAYCLLLAARRGNLAAFTAPGAFRDLRLGTLMAAMWIASFYLYGIGASMLGPWGAIVGWPAFVSLSIGIGILAGLRRGEWKSAPAASLRLLAAGLILLLLAVAVLAFSGRV